MDAFRPALTPNARNSSALWFYLLLAAACLFTLSFPVFPSQDGPMHRYYVHAFAAVLAHHPGYAIYQVRHPFPPYATHYILLLGLSRFMPFDLAEKVFICIILSAFALGFRWTARAVGPAGEWVSLFVAPLLFSWALMMGFFNYVLGVGLVLLALACWERSRGGHHGFIFSYVLTLAVLTFTHPVPLLLLIVITGLDLLLAFLLGERGPGLKRWRRIEWTRTLLWLLTLLALSFPAFAIDKSASTRASTLSQLHFKAEYARTALLLTGISPYNTRSHNFEINAYRVCLYVLFLAGVWLGGKATLRALGERRPHLGTTLFLSIPILLVALPILPNEVNGSFYFSTRLIMVLWPAALIACAGLDAPGLRTRGWLIALAVFSAGVTLAPAIRFFSPVSRQLAAAERSPLPEGSSGVVLLGDTLPEYSRFHSELAFDPYQWGALLPAVTHNALVLDTPWLDQKISPLAATAESGVLLPDIAMTFRSKEYPPAVKGRSLPAVAEARLIDRSAFLLYAGAPSELDQGLALQLSPGEARKFHCDRLFPWYMICQDPRFPGVQR